MKRLLITSVCHPLMGAFAALALAATSTVAVADSYDDWGPWIQDKFADAGVDNVRWSERYELATFFAGDLYKGTTPPVAIGATFTGSVFGYDQDNEQETGTLSIRFYDYGQASRPDWRRFNVDFSGIALLEDMGTGTWHPGRVRSGRGAGGTTWDLYAATYISGGYQRLRGWFLGEDGGTAAGTIEAYGRHGAEFHGGFEATD